MTTRTTPWGATAGDWHHFAEVLGLREDLLPVVSRPDAKISALSKMKKLGKTPSTFNRQGEAVGIPKWTEHHATEADIKRWMANPDHGICMQTRVVRAIDIDIGDGLQAQRVLDVIKLMDIELPTRWRTGSGKCLLAFRMPGEFSKRVVHTAHGIIEFLATGQQFIAAGTHEAGERYQWFDQVSGNFELPGEIPELTPARFEEVWVALQQQFGIAPEITGKQGMRPMTAREASSVNDPVIDFIDAKGMVRSWERDGRVNIHCPWADEHTSDSGETATQWLPAGMGGFEQGHFKCLHAHCAARGRDEFMDAIGYLESEFDVVGPAADAPAPTRAELVTTPVADRPKPVFQRKRNGAIISNAVNVQRALERPDVVGRYVAWDTFRAEIMVAPWCEALEATPHLLQWRSFTDTDYTDLRLQLEGRVGFESVAKELLRDSVHWLAEREQFDSAVEWLAHRVTAWDGVPRVEAFFHRYLAAGDTAYTKAVGVYLWTALAGRVLDPGCKVDMVPILISEEGTGKTTTVEALVPSRMHYVEIDLTRRDDDLARSMRGKLVGEIAELRGLQSRDEESIKAWVTRRNEEWTPKYKEYAISFARRLVFVGTANPGEFLPNDGGAARRWLPVVVGKTDLAALERDRDQLWAEARELWRAGGVAWREANTLGREARDAHRMVDDWQPVIEAWLVMGEMDDPHGPPRGAQPVTTGDVLTSAIGLPVARIGRRDQERAARVLKALGYVRKKVRVAGRGTPAWGFAPTDACEFLRTRVDEPRTDTLDLA